MIPYLIVVSAKVYEGDRFTSKVHIYASFFDFIFFVIFGLNNFF